MLNIPKGVSQKYVDELEDYQKQIVILMRNRQILRTRFDKSEDKKGRMALRREIETVEKYLLEWNEKQKPVLEMIRAEIKELKSKKTPKTRKKKGFRSKKSRSPSTSPSMSDAEIGEETALVLPGQFDGYVTSYEKITPLGYCDLEKRLKLNAEDCFTTPRIERVISSVEREEFMNNLDLIPPARLREIEAEIKSINLRKIEFRNLTYIPELSEKKNRPDYNYWIGAYNTSPPLLRTRQQNSGVAARPKRITRGSTSRAGSPLSRGTSRSPEVSEDRLESTPPSHVSEKRPQRNILSSKSLITRKNANVLALEKKLKELRETIAEFGPRTISTRKERTRRNELLAEELALSKKVARLKNKKI